MKLLRKNLLLGLILGVVYLLIELIFTAITKFPALWATGLIDPKYTSYFTLYGLVSLWMIPIGGLCGVLMGNLNEVKRFKGYNNLIKALIATGIIFVVEFTFGLVFMYGFNIWIWDYTGVFGNVMGIICLSFAPLWIILSPFIFWLDDVLRYNLFNEEKPKHLFTYFNIKKVN